MWIMIPYWEPQVTSICDRYQFNESSEILKLLGQIEKLSWSCYAYETSVMKSRSYNVKQL